MDWKLKDIEDFYTDDFWYDISIGGYIKPEECLSDKEQVKELKNAIDLVKDFESTFMEYVEEM